MCPDLFTRWAFKYKYYFARILLLAEKPSLDFQVYTICRWQQYKAGQTKFDINMSNDERVIRHELVILMSVWQGIMYIMLRIYAFHGYNKIRYGNFKNLMTCRDEGKFLLTRAGTHTCVCVCIYINVMEVKKKVCCLFYAIFMFITTSLITCIVYPVWMGESHSGYFYQLAIDGISH